MTRVHPVADEPLSPWFDLMRDALGYGEAVATESEWLAVIRDAFDNRPCEALASRDPGQVRA